MQQPKLYMATQRGQFFNNRVFWKWMGNAIVHSLVLYFVPMMAYERGVIWRNGGSGGYLVLGNIVYSCVMITVSFKAGLELISWNWICHLAIWGSLGERSFYICGTIVRFRYQIRD